MKRNELLTLTAAILGVAGWSFQTAADTMYLQADQNVSLGSDIAGNTAADGSGAAVTKTKDAGGPPYVYDFADGATGGGTPTTGGFVGGLHLQFRKFYNSANTNAITLDMGDNDLTGASGVTNVYNYRGTGNSIPSASISILNVGDVSLGVIDTHSAGGSGSTTASAAGAVTIGSLADRVGAVRIDAINARAGRDGATSTGAGGYVRIFGSGDVLIRNAAGTVLGDIWAQHWSAGRAGDIEVRHDGAFEARDLFAYAYSTWASGGYHAGDVICDGDSLGGGSRGDFSVRTIRAGVETDSDGGAGRSNTVRIQGYQNVFFAGNLQTYVNEPAQGNSAGSATISNITGNITINGTIDLNHVGAAAKDGYLTLQCGGGITVSNVNLSRVLYASFNAGGHSYITGTILGTNGAAATPTNVTSLRAPAGKRIYYVPSLNSGLNGAQVALNKLDGTSGGGTLMPPSARMTVILCR